MLFSSAFDRHRLVERARQVQQNPLAAYGSAVGLVAVATLVHWGIPGSVVREHSFITFYPTIVVAVLVGGFWPGVLSVFLSAAMAWYLFPPPLSRWPLDQREVISLFSFGAVGGLEVAIVALLNSAVDRVLAQEQNVRVLIESAPNGIVVVDNRGNIRLINAGTERLFGYNRSELVGKSVEVLVPNRQADTHQALRKIFLQAPETRMMGAGRELSGRRNDGSEFPVEIGLNREHAGFRRLNSKDAAKPRVRVCEECVRTITVNFDHFPDFKSSKGIRSNLPAFGPRTQLGPRARKSDDAC